MGWRVLFVCTGNSARSQMAEGLLRQLAGSRFEAFSAGVEPTRLNPLAVRVMGEIGIDISSQRSKHLSEFLGESFASVITVCDSASESCPVFPGANDRRHWSFGDPAVATGTEEERLAVFRRVRDAIRGRIEEFIRESVNSESHAATARR